MPRNRMLQDLRTFLTMYSVSQPAKAGGFMPSRPPYSSCAYLRGSAVEKRATFRFRVVRKPQLPRWKVLLKSGSASLGVSAFLWMTCPSSQLYTPVNEVAWPAANTLALQPDERRRFQVLGRWHRVRNNLAFLHSSPKRCLCTTICSSNCLYFLLLVDWRSKDRGPYPAFGFPHG
jgi:hypothetical protein